MQLEVHFYMPAIILDLVFLGLLAFSLAVAIFRFGRGDHATRIFIGIIFFTLLTECIATPIQYFGGNKYLIYRIANPIELALYCLYFNYSVEKLREYRAGWYLAIITLSISPILQFKSPSNSIGSAFVSFEATLIICLGMYSVYRMLLADTADNLLHNIHFWLGAFTSFLWCGSFFSLSLFDYFLFKNHYHYLGYLTRVIWFANVISQCGILLAFSIIPKKPMKINLAIVAHT